MQRQCNPTGTTSILALDKLGGSIIEQPLSGIFYLLDIF